MPVFENRHCGNGVPTVTNTPLPPLPPAVGDLIPDDLLANIIEFAVRRHQRQRGCAAVPPAGQVRLRRRSHAVPARAGAMTPFERIVRAAARRPARVLRDRRGARGDRLRARAAAGAECGHRHAGRPRGRHLPGDRALSREVRRPLGDRARPRRAVEPAADVEPRPADRARGLPVGQQAGRPAGAGRRELAVRQAGDAQAGEGRLRARHVRQRLGRGDQRPDPGAGQGPVRAGRQGGHGRAPDREGAGQVAGRAEAAGRLGAPARLRPVRARPAADQPQVRARAERAAARRRPELRLGAVLRPVARRHDAEGALRLPVAVVEGGADPGAPEADADRRAAGASGRARARGGADAGVASSRAMPATWSPARRSWPRTSRTRWRGRRCGCCSSASS